MAQMKAQDRIFEMAPVTMSADIAASRDIRLQSGIESPVLSSQRGADSTSSPRSKTGSRSSSPIKGMDPPSEGSSSKEIHSQASSPNPSPLLSPTSTISDRVLNHSDTPVVMVDYKPVAHGFVRIQKSDGTLLDIPDPSIASLDGEASGLDAREVLKRSSSDLPATLVLDPLPPIPCDEAQPSKFLTLVDDVFPCSPEDVWKYVFEDDAPYGLMEFGEETKEMWDMSISAWVPVPGENKIARRISFMAPVKDAPRWSPKECRIHKLQVAEASGDEIRIQSCAVSVGVMYCDYFHMFEDLKITRMESQNSTRVYLRMNPHFTKSTMLKSIIQSKSMGAAKVVQKLWYTKCLGWIQANHSISNGVETGKTAEVFMPLVEEESETLPPLSRFLVEDKTTRIVVLLFGILFIVAFVSDLFLDSTSCSTFALGFLLLANLYRSFLMQESILKEQHVRHKLVQPGSASFHANVVQSHMEALLSVCTCEKAGELQTFRDRLVMWERALDKAAKQL